MRGLDASSGWTALLPGFIAAGIGVGLVNPPLASTAVAVVTPQNSGMASGINSTFRQVGIATGIAGLGAIFQHVVLRNSLANLQRMAHLGGAKAHSLAAAVTSGGGAKQAFTAVPVQARQQVQLALKSGFTSGMNQILLVAAALAILGGLLALALIRQSDFAGAHAGQQQREPEPAAADPARAFVSLRGGGRYGVLDGSSQGGGASQSQALHPGPYRSSPTGDVDRPLGPPCRE